MLDICSFVSRNFKVHHDVGYDSEYANITKYKTCNYAQYKPNRGRTLIAYKKLKYFLINPRLQRLFMSLETIEYMIWHHSYDEVDGVIVHPFDGEAWKQFNRVQLEFSLKQ